MHEKRIGMYVVPLTRMKREQECSATGQLFGWMTTVVKKVAMKPKKVSKNVLPSKTEFILPLRPLTLCDCTRKRHSMHGVVAYLE
jgi:hypothetical protein